MAEEAQETVRQRSFWRIARHFLIPLLLVLALFGGLIAGYVVLGHQSAGGVLEWKTWKHVYDLVFAP
ncbi:DNA-directed RNA polymerase subunit beta [Paenibacillus sp. JX-17]|uniref:DNA-directed RNA polymerase subunit beta n=1 Tax=Paenibacillus lacisoli TaxID=3064525 RepID=A0ABT9CFS8_9BACL|nr:DNA-directed RNA polymerase subunit beta [Paenibacillus sp. JX-17]MDO7906536.1 DNA-directed RNA polymerase subunit beta [Paenibacillus sp. JX-17]